MSNGINWKPFVGQKVVALQTSMGKEAIKGEVYTCHAVQTCPSCGIHHIILVEVVDDYNFAECNCGCALSLDHFPHGGGASKYFAPYNPYSNSVSKELAEKAMNVGDGADQPIKIKELIQN